MPNLTPTMLSALNVCLMVRIIDISNFCCGKLLTTMVVLICNSDGLSAPRSHVMLIVICYD